MDQIIFYLIHLHQEWEWNLACVMLTHKNVVTLVEIYSKKGKTSFFLNGQFFFSNLTNIWAEQK